MSVFRWVATTALVVGVMATAGCRAGDAPESGSPSLVEDSALRAVRRADVAVKAVAPDAVLMMIDSQGVVLTPPPGNWSLLYGSKSTGRLYRVNVDHGIAEDPEDLSPRNLDAALLDGALAPSSVKIGAQAALEAAREYVEKRDGEVPPNVMMSLAFVRMPGAAIGKWSVAFLTGTSTDGMKQVRVDAQTGEVTPAE